MTTSGVFTVKDTITPTSVRWDGEEELEDIEIVRNDKKITEGS